MNVSLESTSFSPGTSINKITGIKERYLWHHYVERSSQFDFYHTYDYHLMDTEGEPLLVVYEEEDKFFALPLIKRRIEETSYFDCTTVYGYVGALTNMGTEAFFESNLTQRFLVALREFLLTENIVCCFSILHPLFGQKEIFRNIGGCLKHIGKTVAINLTIPLEEQRLMYRRQIRTKVNQLRRKGYEVRLADSNKELREFISIYRENMIKVEATEKYLFEDSYFESFMASKDFMPELLLAYYENKIVAGAMIGITKSMVQLHLAGTRNEFLKESPMKLIFDEAALLGRTRKLEFLHLGSGVNGKEDSLFHFKTGFSEYLFDFTAWQFIANEAVYNELVKGKIEKGASLNPHYFPLYRSC